MHINCSISNSEASSYCIFLYILLIILILESNYSWFNNCLSLSSLGFYRFWMAENIVQRLLLTSFDFGLFAFRINLKSLWLKVVEVAHSITISSYCYKLMNFKSLINWRRWTVLRLEFEIVVCMFNATLLSNSFLKEWYNFALELSLALLSIFCEVFLTWSDFHCYLIISNFCFLILSRLWSITKLLWLWPGLNYLLFLDTSEIECLLISGLNLGLMLPESCSKLLNSIYYVIVRSFGADFSLD